MPFTAIWVARDRFTRSNVRWGAATHGCIGVPVEFAQKLFDQVSKGDQVVIVSHTEPSRLAS